MKKNKEIKISKMVFIIFKKNKITKPFFIKQKSDIYKKYHFN